MNKYPLEPIDANGRALVTGDKVLFKKAPETLINGLPQDDQKAIGDQEEKPGFFDSGNVTFVLLMPGPSSPCAVSAKSALNVEKKHYHTFRKIIP